MSAAIARLATSAHAAAGPVFLLALLALLTAVGCGGDGGAPTAPPPETPAPTQPPPAPTPTPEPAATFREGDRIPSFPTGAPSVVSGGSFSISGGVVTITLRRDGYVQYPEHRFTCDASECGIREGLVTAGVIVRTATERGGTAGLAPATQAEFEARVVGRQVVQGTFRLIFIAPGRIREIDDGTPYEGDYEYRRTGSNSGMIVYTYDVTGNDPNRERSEVRFAFRTETSGTYEYSYFEGGTRAGSSSGSFEFETAPTGSTNRAPRTVGSIADQTLTEDGSATTVNVSARFSDPDGDTLGYRASSSRTSVVRTSVSGSRVTLTPRDAGTATVTVTATDPGGLSATQRFMVTVTASGGGEGAGTFREGDRIPGFPTGIPSVVSGGSFSISGGVTTITLRRGGYVEYPEHRYTCEASSCEIRGGVVTAGVIVRTARGDSGSPTTGSTGDECSIENMGTLRTTALTRSGSLGRDCESPNESGKLARYYSFRVSETSEVRIDLESSAFDPLLFLRQGSSLSGRQIERDDDGGSGRNARIERELSAGTYTIEATSFRSDTTGAFTLRVARTGGGGTPTGKAVEFVGDLECSVREQIPGSGFVIGIAAGRVRAARSVSLVTVTGTFTERDGDRRVHSLFPDSLGSMRAGETESFSSQGTFSTSATRFGCSAEVVWTETRQAGRGSVRTVAPTSIPRSPPN